MRELVTDYALVLSRVGIGYDYVLHRMSPRDADEVASRIASTLAGVTAPPPLPPFTGTMEL